MDKAEIREKAVKLAETIPLVWTEDAVTRELYGYCHPIVNFDETWKAIAKEIDVPVHIWLDGETMGRLSNIFIERETKERR